MASGKRILIVGGVAGGASCAARARRLSEEAEIIMFEKGPFVSFANCGLPFHIGDVIEKEEALMVASPQLFKERFNVDVRVNSEVVSIDRRNSEIAVKDLSSGETYTEKYDALVLSPGAAPVRLPIPGIDLPGVFTLRNIPDTRRIREWVSANGSNRALVVGGGFIGLEMTENLVKRGLTVTIVEAQSHVMPALDPEMVSPVHSELKRCGVSLRLGESVTGFQSMPDGSIRAGLASGGEEQADIVIVCVGVRPETKLAREAGLEIGELGGIRVDSRMRTSDPAIWAVGDAVEVRDFITGGWTLIPLAGPANRQGRVAADVILGRDREFRGVQGTAVCGVFDVTVASTGLSEKTLKRLGLWKQDYEKIYLHPGHHALYYPGARTISLKLIFSKKDGRIIGCQAAGKEGVEKRVDVISMAIQSNRTVFDLEEAELCYAPQYGSAKDPVNMAGMIAANVLRGDSSIAQWDEIASAAPFVLDVRDVKEFGKGHVEQAVNIPLDQLRTRMNEVPGDRDVWAYCLVGQRSYYAMRLLSQNGFNVKSISGGYRTFLAAKGGK
ncbi:FAD-dependent oxidoreductase [Syntrophobacter fumaroxidans]|uniref:FAD-dependent pyridine nucleotide-disulphide oxidoreductase n=1 Tax=Syntrophobacter fumaroxidans (strain DSM 10017 / MPOB) TaxID=335543 RepID=A0LI37_SYNFM|nr:FAD-dependent oxidoreductase [Syntrophobacter fumaroxidans]ABK17089.1 FAD-dependent pyridine nucleotide-disulphide oxidoreductase [Syntrophobacter fumaroxidans MPOB]